MTRSTVRKLQITCFMVAHIPLIAVSVFAYFAEVSDQISVVAVAFFATLAAAILLWTSVGRMVVLSPEYENA